MKFIAHRGNFSGPSDRENHPSYIREALSRGYDVEIDLWYDGKFGLGHDKAEYQVDLNFLLNYKYWIHCKNIGALNELMGFRGSLNFFFHESDACVLTSGGYIWVYPGGEVSGNSVAVMPEMVPGWDYSGAYAVCSDYLYVAS